MAWFILNTCQIDKRCAVTWLLANKYRIMLLRSKVIILKLANKIMQYWHFSQHRDTRRFYCANKM